MPPKNRSTLKNYFKSGALPSQNQFEDLIDSSLNLVEDGFDKSPENGLEVSSLGEHDSLISFGRDRDRKKPVWTISYRRGGDELLLRQMKEEKTVLSFAPEGKVGVNKGDPETQLDVGGVIRAEGRAGVCPKGAVPADGKWRAVTDDLYGCQAFEVMAGAGKKGTGRYALMHAFALNSFNPKGYFFNFLRLKKRIKCHNAYYRSRSDMLRLRWVGDRHSYRLEMKTNGDYGDGILIQYHLTSLWFDEEMSGCKPQSED